MSLLTQAREDLSPSVTIELVSGNEPWDVAVVDADSSAIERGATGEIDLLLGRPKLLLISSPDDERTLIERGLAEPADEFCRSDAEASEFRLRLTRLIARVIDQVAKVDGLTGLMSRRAFAEASEIALKNAAPEAPVSIILADLDDFKRLNEAHGHAAGDLVIQGIANVLRAASFGVDLVARYGGEEFFLLVHEADEQTRALAEFLRSEIEEARIEIDENKTISVTATLGVATSTGDIDLDSILRRADQALYHGKGAGKNTIFSYAQIAEDGTQNSIDVELQGYEDRVHVLTQRLSEELARRSRRMISRVRDEAERDGLTGLFNRRYFDERMQREIENAVRSDRRLCVAMIDLDKFGAINRTYGFPGGDRALTLAARALGKASRSTDWVARYGGEEFVVVMPDTVLKDAVAVAERLRSQVEAGRTEAVDGREIRVTASIGVVELDGSAASMAPPVPEFIQRASDKLREAKNTGRNRVCS